LAHLLRPWPLLFAAVTSMLGAILLTKGTPNSQIVAAVLLAVSAVCVGAWIALLSNSGYSGHDDGPSPPGDD
jgi:CHASE2 domain-containing sensor protein